MDVNNKRFTSNKWTERLKLIRIVVMDDKKNLFHHYNDLGYQTGYNFSTHVINIINGGQAIQGIRIQHSGII